jgi:aminopeptidase
VRVETTATEGGVLAAERLARYADAVVRSCLKLDAGGVLFIQGQPAHRELMVALAEAAYRAGAAEANVEYLDNLISAARIRLAADEHLGPLPDWAAKRLRTQLEPRSASVTIIGEGDPGAFDKLPSARIVDDSQRRMGKMQWWLRAIKAGRYRWTGCAWPTPYWAGQVYPELDPVEAQRQLAEDLLWFCRLGPDDPPGAEGWEAHVEAIARRGQILTELRLERLELRGPGTHLDVRLPEDARWLGGQEANAYGRLVSPNFPTEENFTSPTPGATTGTFRCSRPLSFRGRLIAGIAGEFRGGQLVRLEAANETDRELLAAFLASDKGASRLGELALVDRTSRIGRMERHYANTLIDENAAAHIAFGYGFDQARVRPARGGGAHRVNSSNLHLDVMIGTDELEVTGFAAGGRMVPLLRGGEWQI